MKGFIRAAFKPIKAIVVPIIFVGERVYSMYSVAAQNKRQQEQVLKLQNEASVKYQQRLAVIQAREGGGREANATAVIQTSASDTAVPGGINEATSAVAATRLRKSNKSNNNNALSPPPPPVQTFDEMWTAFTERYNLWEMAVNRVMIVLRYIRKLIFGSSYVAAFQVQCSLLYHRYILPKISHNSATTSTNSSKEGEEGGLALSLAALGGQQAPWRVKRTLHNTYRLLQRLQHHIVAELRNSKQGYINDHDLLISVLDHTIDSAGMLTLVLPYNYNRLFWFKVIYLEITIYAIIGSVLNIYTNWILRATAFIVINNVFGFLTYICNPFTEELDKWLDFTGRVLVTVVLLGTIICYLLNPHTTDESPSQLYAPWVSASYVANTGQRSFGFYQIIDILMCLYFYCYIVYILYVNGVFGVVERYVQAFQFGYHDHILDFLVECLDQRSFGLENIFSGLQFVQQWDDIIKSQRRYALLTWPDVRPATLASFSAKMFEIKWASMFNLTLSNLRSSLGLSVLHTVMFSADGDVARWVIHNNPELLLVADSQNDTPITIALKECAYFLLAYGEQKGGVMDDGTTYSDEHYAVYYPEIDDLRDEVFTHGEFVTDLCTIYCLTSTDLDALKATGKYTESAVVDDAAAGATAAPLTHAGTSAKKKKPQPGTLEAARLAAEEVAAAKKVEKKRKAKLRAAQAKAKREKESLFSLRFPEDGMLDNFEVGQMTAWTVLGLPVSDESLYLDRNITKKMIKDNDYSYELPPVETVNHKYLNPSVPAIVDTPLEDDIESNAGESQSTTTTTTMMKRKKAATVVPIFSSTPAAAAANAAMTTNASGNVANHMKDVADAAVTRDMQYVVRTIRKVHPISDRSIEVPFQHEGMQMLLDWDKPRLTKRSRNNNNNNSSSKRNNNNNAEIQSQSTMNFGFEDSGFGGGSTMSNLSSEIMSIDSSGELISARTKLNSAKTNRETCWRICKFAEILMSEEIAHSCHDMKWKIADFKAFNKLASEAQGQIAQNLAMTCSLNAPPGFVRVSEWSKLKQNTMYDEAAEVGISMVVKGVVAIVGTAERMTEQAVGFITSAAALPQAGMNILPRFRGGRYKYYRSTLSSGGVSGRSGAGSLSVKHGDDKAVGMHGAGKGDNQRLFSDRIVQFFAEALVCSTTRLILDDAELSHDGRIGWRAIARALRRKHCSFVLASLFVPPKPIKIVQLVLTRNELDCGDCVYLSDIFVNQLHLEVVDLSFNRIGARGMTRMCQALKDHPNIRTFRIDNNGIGPATGKSLGLWLKKTTSLRFLSMSSNRMGEIVRFPTLYSREKLPSAVHDIFTGMRSNKTLEYLDLSYNHLGPDTADVVPIAIDKHPRLHTLNLAGSDLGSIKGTKLLFYLSGFPRGAERAVQQEEFVRNVKSQQSQQQLMNAGAAGGVAIDQSYFKIEPLPDLFLDEDHEDEEDDDGGGKDNMIGEDSMFSDNSSNLATDHHPLSSPNQKNGRLHSPSAVKGDNDAQQQLLNSVDSTLLNAAQVGTCKHPASLTSLSVADNQLGPFAGHAVASLIERNKSLTHLDISGNSLTHIGGEYISDQIELMYGIKPREFLKIVLWEIEESKYTGRRPKKRKKVFTTLTSLNISRNGLGSNVIGSLFYSLSHPNCTITNLDISDNPVGYNGELVAAATDIRHGLANSKSLRYLNFNRTQFMPMQLVPVLGGIAHNHNLLKLTLQDVKLDEPSCLQLCYGIGCCATLVHIDLQRCNMGTNGATLIANKIRLLADRIVYLDLNDNFMGPVAAMHIGEALSNPTCKIKTLRVAHNDLVEEGGCFIAKGLVKNLSVTDVDFSGNYLTHAVGSLIADAARGHFVNGKKISDSKLKRLIINNNPLIGHKAARVLMRAICNDCMEYLEIRDIGAKPGAANIIAAALRDPVVAWRYLDVRGNYFSRAGLNQIFWAMRQNKRLRILKCGENRAGTKFCSNSDNLLSHGISVPQFMRRNVVLRELDLSYNGLSTEAGINILDALIDNHTIKKLSLRGNVIDDNISVMIPDLLRCNNVLEELDLGYNRLGFSCAYALAESLEGNRSIKTLILDYNRFGGAGSATLDLFTKSIMMNYCLQVLVIDGNKLGPDWGIRLAETFSRNSTLLQVSLRDNRLDSRAGKALLNSFKHCPYMVELALSADEVGQELWEEFRRVFEYKRASTSPNAYYRETTITEAQSKILSSYMSM